MQQGNGEDTPSYTKEQILWKIRTALAGRAAELEFFGEEKGINTGVSSDLQNATNLALSMICRYAMDEEHLLSISPEALLASPRGEVLIEKTNEILKVEMENTRGLIREGRDKIQKLSDYLLENNQATENEIKKIFEQA